MAYDGEPEDWRPERRDKCTTCDGTGFDEDQDPWRN